MDKKRIKDMESKLKATVLIEQGYQDQIAELKAEKFKLGNYIATLQTENECLAASCKATVNCKADAIREMLDEIRVDGIRWVAGRVHDAVVEYADKLEGLELRSPKDDS